MPKRKFNRKATEYSESAGSLKEVLDQEKGGKKLLVDCDITYLLLPAAF